jgi:hypothetical protein
VELLRDILKKDWQKALEQDEASLKALKAAIAELEAGKKVENLRLPEAREEEKALEKVIKNKKHFISKLARKEFEHTFLIEKVASRYCQAMEFPTEEALKAYLKRHPGADKSKHTVMKKEEGSEKKPGDKSESEEYESVTGGNKHKSIPDRLKLLEKHPKNTVEEYGEYDDLPVGVGDDLIRISGIHLKKVIHKLSKLPIATLKKRHTFIGKQLETARSQHDDKTVKNLQEMRKHIERAADKKDEETKK